LPYLNQVAFFVESNSTVTALAFNSNTSPLTTKVSPLTTEASTNAPASVNYVFWIITVVGVALVIILIEVVLRKRK
jgi:hypothetical protein